MQRKVPGRESAPQRGIGGEFRGVSHLAETLADIPHGHAVDAGQTPRVFRPSRFFGDWRLGTCSVLKGIHGDLIF